MFEILDTTYACGFPREAEYDWNSDFERSNSDKNISLATGSLEPSSTAFLVLIRKSEYQKSRAEHLRQDHTETLSLILLT